MSPPPTSLETITALSQMEHFMCTCGLTDLQWPLRARVRYVHETVGCPIPHFSVQKGARERELVECLKWTIKIKCYLTNTFFIIIQVL